MKSSVYKSYDELPLFLNSDLVAKNTRHRTVQRIRTDARKEFSNTAHRQPHGGSERKVHPVGGGAHEGRWARMRKTKPPVGWEHVKNCFPVPNILLDMDLPASAVAVYLYLLRSADRKTDQCHPSEATIAKRLHLSRNTVAKYVRLLEERGLIITEHTKIITKNGIKKNGNLLYTLVSMHEITQAYYDRQFEKAELATMQQKAKAKAEKLGIEFIPAGDGQSA